MMSYTDTPSVQVAGCVGGFQGKRADLVWLVIPASSISIILLHPNITTWVAVVGGVKVQVAADCAFAQWRVYDLLHEEQPESLNLSGCLLARYHNTKRRTTEELGVRLDSAERSVFRQWVIFWAMLGA